MADTPISRRDLLSIGLGAGAGVFAHRVAGESVVREACTDATPPQTEGPYYPTRDREDEDVDLTRVKGRNGRASGDVVHVRGRILDEDCRPVDGALVEIWQANTWGRYDHERDAGNPRPLDPKFQSWGEVRTDAEGRYGFKTIKPGSYPADDSGWIRPPHIHFKVSRRGFHELITQMYFAGEALNDTDRIRQSLMPEERERVTITFQPSAEVEKGARVGVFEITLRKA